METVTPKKEYAIDSPSWSCRNRDERLYPTREWGEGNMLYTPVKSIEHLFLQKLIDFGAILTNVQGEWTIFANKSLIMLHVYDGFINLECISTPVEDRGQGSATNVMKAFVAAAKETNTEVRLRACNVTGGNWMGGMDHIVVNHGKQKKGKIPTGSLPKWYAKFGFVKVANCMYRGKKNGINMVFNPQN